MEDASIFSGATRHPLAAHHRIGFAVAGTRASGDDGNGRMKIDRPFTDHQPLNTIHSSPFSTHSEAHA